MNLDFNTLTGLEGERLHSLKHEVVRLQTFMGTIIRKRYSNQDAYEREIKRLYELQAVGLHVPCVLYHEPNIAFFQDLGNMTYVDVLDFDYSENNPGFKKPVDALLHFLFSYYRATQYVRGDVNLRNFLYCDGICYGIDFEEPPAKGEIELDLGRMLAYVLTYDPAFSDKRVDFAHVLWQGCISYDLRPALLWQHMQQEFFAMRERRGGFAQIFEKAVAFLPDWEGLHA